MNLFMEYQHIDKDTIDKVMEKITNKLKIVEEKQKEMPCHEYIKFDKSFNLISKEQYCNVMKVLLTLFSLNYNKDSFIYYDDKTKEWKTAISKGKIDKQKLSEICYEIYYNDNNPAFFRNKTLYIIITRKIKSYYKSEFEPKPIFMPFKMDLTYIPTISNFSNFNPSHLMISSKYSMIDLNYKPDETLKFNITEDYEGK